jgi:hypothetical protein
MRTSAPISRMSSMNTTISAMNISLYRIASAAVLGRKQFGMLEFYFVRYASRNPVMDALDAALLFAVAKKLCDFCRST